MKTEKIIKLMEKRLGPYDKSDEENNRLIFGNLKNEINKIYFCWRLTSEILRKLELNKKTLIICHEPFIYKIKDNPIIPINNFTLKSNKEKLKLIWFCT